MIVECHKRNMEFHAWINPYRVTTSKNETLPQDHLYYTNPERFVKYASKIYFDPGLPQNRNHIRRVIRDIVGRYDVDAIHFDDYFYPYPEKGEAFNDFDSFESYRLKAGFSKDQIADWRRSNVNTLIKSVQSDIKSIKPWVRFGISPFGIYRNDPEGKTGSKTNGTEGYSQLYADALLWTKEGWIDYIIPQLYWEIGHKAADYNTLCKWWNDNANNQHLYIGQSISRSVDDGVKSFKVSDRHLEDKITLASKLPFVNGNCFWYGYQINDNENNIRDILQNKYYKYNALIPEYKNLDDRQPKEVKKLKTKWTEKG